MLIGYTRRKFLIEVAGAVVAPLALSACRRRSAPPPGAEIKASVDEPENAASFRPPLPSSEPLIRVRVFKVRSSSGPDATILRIGEEGQWVSVRGESAAGKGAALSGPIDVVMEPSGWAITDAKGFRAAVEGREPVGISPLDDEGSQRDGGLSIRSVSRAAGVSAAGASLHYPGSLRLVWREDLSNDQTSADSLDCFDVINHVPLEMYLPGVLAGELFNHWNPQTFAAQAVAARSFACTEAAVFAGKRHYDVTNTSASQMYLGSVGAGKGHTRARLAVQETSGLLLSYESLLVSGYYSSCCGGSAASAVDAIGSNPVNDAAPLHGRSGTDVCTEASVFRWKVEQPIELLTRRLAAFAKERRLNDLAKLARLAAIDVIGANANGRPTRVRIVDEHDAAVELSAENLRRGANFSGPGLDPPAKPLRSSYIRAAFDNDKVIFDGYGFGHGVGLCQYGAEALARSGKDHREILAWYYPGAELVRAYG